MKTTTLQAILLTSSAAALFAAILWPGALRPVQSATYFERIAGALEAYAIDHNGQYPPDNFSQQSPNPNAPFTLPNALTTPVAYLQPQDLRDPLGTTGQVTNRLRYINFDGTYRDSTNVAFQTGYRSYYAIHGSWMVWSGLYRQGNLEGRLMWDPIPYDPTNGAISAGTHFRSQRLNTETGVAASTP